MVAVSQSVSRGKPFRANKHKSRTASHRAVHSISLQKTTRGPQRIGAEYLLAHHAIRIDGKFRSGNDKCSLSQFFAAIEDASRAFSGFYQFLPRQHIISFPILLPPQGLTTDRPTDRPTICQDCQQQRSVLSFSLATLGNGSRCKCRRRPAATAQVFRPIKPSPSPPPPFRRRRFPF